MTTRPLTLARPWVGTTLPFALPIGLSAFLLFSVEPLVGRLVLPVFGGTPAVWATTLFFFQAVLLVGYLYGHVSSTRLGSWGPILHLVLVGLGLVSLVIAPVHVADLRDGAITPVLDLVRVLLVVIGLPALVLTTTTPLVSSWFDASRTDRSNGDPYWLYALSNGGSLLALLAYPLLIEPRLGLTAQRGLWALGYVVLAVLLGFAAVRAMPAIRLRQLQLATAVAARVADVAPITWARRGRWFLLAAIPSGLLSAVTTYIATDLVSAPLLWVVPLAIYLGTFIVAFSPRGGRLVRSAVVGAPAFITLLWVPYGSPGGWPILAILLLECVGFAVVALALHGRLALDRPDGAHLTEFYLVLSVGGAVASGFVALVAPTVFAGIWEYPILLVGALVALALTTPAAAGAAPVATPTSATTRRGLDFSPFLRGIGGRLGPYLVVGGLLALVLVVTDSPVTEIGLRWLLVGGLILAVGARPWFLAIATAFVLVLATFVLQPPAEFRARSFFGVTQVLRPGDAAIAVLFNGTTVHGTQLRDPALEHLPTTYYGRNGPVGDVFAVAAARASSQVGIVGLGAGTLAAYDVPGMAITYYEIDPVVVRVASDPSLFTYLADAPTRPDIVLGDARLSLRDTPDATYDLLVLDAFSSDAVPVHLLTVEALTDALRTVGLDGVIAIHISNRYYDLSPAVSAALDRLGLVTLHRGSRVGDNPDDPTELAARWLSATRDPGVAAGLQADGWTVVPPGDHPFTDDYSDLLRYLRIGF